MPGLHLSWRLKLKPCYDEKIIPRLKQKGKAPKDRHEVRHLMAGELCYQFWSALRRGSMEMRQQAGRALVLRQVNQINEKAARLNDQDDEGSASGIRYSFTGLCDSRRYALYAG